MKDTRKPADRTTATKRQKRPAMSDLPSRDEPVAVVDLLEDQSCAVAGTWNLYIVECSDGTLYTGITTDIERRLKEHNADAVGGKQGRGAAYTRARRPVNLVYSESLANRSLASQREYQVKQLSRKAKLRLVAGRQ